MRASRPVSETFALTPREREISSPRPDMLAASVGPTPTCKRANALMWSAVTGHRFGVWLTCQPNRTAFSDSRNARARLSSTATSRLPKAVTSPRTPKASLGDAEDERIQNDFAAGGHGCVKSLLVCSAEWPIPLRRSTRVDSWCGYHQNHSNCCLPRPMQ